MTMMIRDAAASPDRAAETAPLTLSTFKARRCLLGAGCPTVASGLSCSCCCRQFLGAGQMPRSTATLRVVSNETMCCSSRSWRLSLSSVVRWLVMNTPRDTSVPIPGGCTRWLSSRRRVSLSVFLLRLAAAAHNGVLTAKSYRSAVPTREPEGCRMCC
jgi:hypothetical protein